MLVLFIAAVGVCVLIAFWYFSAEVTLRRELRKAPRRKIKELGDGDVGRIVGAVAPHETLLTAPLTGRRCAYYIVRVEQLRSHGKSSTWRKLIEEREGVPFVIEDDTGRAIVDPNSARVSLEIDSRSKSGSFDDPNDVEKAFLARHGKSGEGVLFNKSLRYLESVIEEHEVVAVLGSGVREPDPDAPPADAYRGEQPTRLRLTSSAAYPLVISDRKESTRS